MTSKTFWLLLCVLFSVVTLAGCASPGQVSEVIPTQTLAPPEPVKAATPTVQPTKTTVIPTQTLAPQEPVKAATPTVQPTKTTVIPTPTPGSWHLLILGDSSLHNGAEIYPPIIERDLGVKVVVEDYSLGGLAMNEVLQVLKTGKSSRPELPSLPNAISDADMVVMFIGNPAGSLIRGNQFNMNGCLFDLASPKNCEPASLEQYTTDLKWIWGEIFRLRNGKPTILRTMDLYTPLINEYKEKGLLSACTECLENYSDAIRLAAEAYHIPFIHRYDIYNGVNHHEDAVAKGYILENDVHPSDLGAQLIAEQLSQLGYEPVPPP
jgi:hypothetical protein